MLQGPVLHLSLGTEEYQRRQIKPHGSQPQVPGSREHGSAQPEESASACDRETHVADDAQEAGSRRAAAGIQEAAEAAHMEATDGSTCASSLFSYLFLH